jgi:lipid A 4'-phosphatase
MGLVGLGFIGCACVALVTDMDLALSAYFYDPITSSSWPIGEAPPWRWLYQYGPYPTLVLAVAACLGWLGSLVWPIWARYRTACLLLSLAVALGPGLLVNGLLKPYWGRPRPRQVQTLGGSMPYREWWQPGGPGAGQSFPSGHAAMGYVLVAGVYLVPQRRSRWPRALAGAGTLSYGTIVGFARMAQGGHFASDVLWAGGLMCLIVGLLQVALRSLSQVLGPPTQLREESPSSR